VVLVVLAHARARAGDQDAATTCARREGVSARAMTDEYDQQRDHNPQLLEIAWRVRGATGRVMECSIYADDRAGFLVRMQCEATRVIRDCHVRSVRKARRKAEDWRQTLLSLSGYEECGVTDD
jgi:hypothetical protein